MCNELIVWHHLSEGFGAHSSAEATLSKLLLRHHWPTMVVGSCGEYKKLRRLALQSTVRSDLYDGPFVCLFMDHVGPLRSTGRTLTCVCAFPG